jgi:hypothetical protein
MRPEGLAGDMTPEEKAEHERISQIKDFWEWHYAITDFWIKYYDN